MTKIITLEILVGIQAGLTYHEPNGITVGALAFSICAFLAVLRKESPR